jgi:hypothetical protein
MAVALNIFKNNYAESDSYLQIAHFSNWLSKTMNSSKFRIQYHQPLVGRSGKAEKTGRDDMQIRVSGED